MKEKITLYLFYFAVLLIPLSIHQQEVVAQTLPAHSVVLKTNLTAPVSRTNLTAPVSKEIGPWWSFGTGEVIVYVTILLVATIVPLVYDMALGSKNRHPITREPGYTPGLGRVLLAFGILLALGILVFHVLITLTTNIQSPNPSVQDINKSLIDLVKNISTVLGGAVSAIIGFYFGQRATQQKGSADGGKQQ